MNPREHLTEPQVVPEDLTLTPAGVTPRPRRRKPAALADTAPDELGEGVDAAFRELDRSRRIGWARAFAAERQATGRGEPERVPAVSVSSNRNHRVLTVSMTGYTGPGRFADVELYLSEEAAMHLAKTLLAHCRRTRRLDAAAACGWTTTLSWPEETIPGKNGSR